jgi:hypothetical protein
VNFTERPSDLPTSHKPLEGARFQLDGNLYLFSHSVAFLGLVWMDLGVFM